MKYRLMSLSNISFAIANIIPYQPTRSSLKIYECAVTTWRNNIPYCTPLKILLVAVFLFLAEW